jgi:hypothetical protein
MGIPINAMSSMMERVLGVEHTHVRQIYSCLSCCNSTSVDIGGRQEGYRRFDSDPRLQNFLNSPLQGDVA